MMTRKKKKKNIYKIIVIINYDNNKNKNIHTLGKNGKI
jgi:hypothetical protein